MAKRLFDILAASAALIILSPVLLVATIGVRLSGRGPILFVAKRAGLHGTSFSLHKFRTMRVANSNSNSAITASSDSRITAIGKFLRGSKIDELPQLFDVLRGKMSIIGPRPEDIRIVKENYALEHLKTLDVRPGLASPGSIYNYTHGHKMIGEESPEEDYLKNLLPIKLALESVYVEKSGFLYDMRIVARTMVVICLVIAGRKTFNDPPEMEMIRTIVPARNQVAASANHRPATVTHNP